jgi:hypothetical protein
MGSENYIGKHFGRLTVIEPIYEEHKRTRWRCLCECGKETVVGSIHHLTSGNTRSCGCLHNEVAATNHYKHGGKGTRLYNIWKNARQRCRNKNNRDFNKWYGVRGIKFTTEWDDFEKFKEWAEANGYSDDLTLDRIDPNGDYCPNNCRWASWKEQRHNQRRSKEVVL